MAMLLCAVPELALCHHAFDLDPTMGSEALLGLGRPEDMDRPVSGLGLLHSQGNPGPLKQSKAQLKIAWVPLQG